jgi:hypothetical protein
MLTATETRTDEEIQQEVLDEFKWQPKIPGEVRESRDNILKGKT